MGIVRPFPKEGDSIFGVQWQFAADCECQGIVGVSRGGYSFQVSVNTETLFPSIISNLKKSAANDLRVAGKILACRSCELVMVVDEFCLFGLKFVLF